MIDQKVFKLVNEFASALTLKDQDAYDIAQIAFESLVRWPNYNKKTPAFYYVVVKRAKQDFYSGTQTRDIPVDTIPESPVEQNTFNLAYIKELDTKFSKLVKNSSGNQRKVLGMQYEVFKLMYEGFSLVEMAKALNSNNTTIGHYIKLVCEKIKEKY